MIRFIVPALLILLSACDASKLENATTSQPEKPVKKEFDLQGHRGARGLYPENSIEGFLGALDLQVNTLEMDVVITKDGQVIVSHEPWISSLICWDVDDKPVPSGNTLNIYTMTYSEVTNYNCGSQSHPDFLQQAKFPTFKPLLSEVITEVEKHLKEKSLPAVSYNIEIKSTPEGDDIFHPAPKEFVAKVLEVITKGGIANRTIIQAFDVRALQAAKAAAPSIPVALLISETKGFDQDLEDLGFTPEIYSPNFRLVNSEMVQNCRSNNIRIIPWTVNEERDMQVMLELGVDGIITDYPDMALTLKL